MDQNITIGYFASLDPKPKLKDPHDPKFVADVKERLKNVHKINNATDLFRVADDALMVIEALEEKPKRTRLPHKKPT